MDDSDFLMESETIYASGLPMTFVHLGVSRFTPGVLRRMKHLWPSIRRQLPPIVFAQGDRTDAKWCKFVEQFGFVPVLDDCPCSDGGNRRIFAHFRNLDVQFT